MPPRAWTEAKAKRVWNLRKKKKQTYEEIGTAVGISKDTASRWILEMEQDKALQSRVLASGKKKTNGKPNGRKPEKGDALRKWLEKNPGGTRADFTKETGIEVSSGYFSRVSRKAAIEELQGPPPKKGSDPVAHMENKVHSLKDRNAFLEWWVRGERLGYIERLLNELGD
jgi:hypothetical protein